MGVTGATTTAGILNSGGLTNTGGLNTDTLNSASLLVSGAAVIGGNAQIGVVRIDAASGLITGASFSGTSDTPTTISSVGTTTISSATKTVIKGGTNTGILALQDGDVAAAGGVPAGSSITIAGSAPALNGAQTVFQTTTNANTSQVATRVGTSATNVASTSLLQAGSNSVSVDSVTGTTVTGSLQAAGNASVGGTLGVTGQTTTNGLGNTGLLANTGNFTNSGTATIGGATRINNTLTVTGNTALTGQQITLGAANGSSVVTIPGLATGGDSKFVTTNANGTVGTSQYSINQYNQALQSVTDQVESVGAMAAALSAIPAITTGDKKFACGVGTGAFGSTWAGAVGCVGRIASNVWVNGALSFTPSVETAFGETPSVGGRLGVFFQF